MRTVTLISAALIAFTWSVVAGAGEPNPTEPAYLYRAVVVNVVDGDTIDADIDLGFYVWIKKQRIRLLGIEAPEPKGATRPEGERATEFLKSLIDGKTIILRTVKGNDGGDRDDSFGRWLGTVYLNGVDVNAEMIDSGHAARYEYR
jgi:micrococcal nuclease